jgi:hypothetical protein
MIYPREFFDTFVLPAIEEWQLDHKNLRRAVIALCELDNLAEHVIIY